MSNNYNILNFKKGFSLFEAFVVMLIISIFVALMANTVAHKPKKKVAAEAHGRFECYYENGKLYQQMFIENSSSGREQATRTIEINGENKKVCEFIPSSFSKYLIINAVGGGAGGTSSEGASEGQFVSTFYSAIERRYYIYPGVGGRRATSSRGAENGEETLVYSVDTDGSTDIMIVAAGGKAVSSLENTTLDDVLACSMPEWCTQDSYDCHITPSCEVSGGKIKVSFCRSKGVFVTVPLEYKVYKKNSTEVELGNPRYVVNNIFTEKKNANTWVYHDISQFSDYDEINLDPTANYRKLSPSWRPRVDDIYVPSKYTMELLMDTEFDGVNPTPSNLHRVINSLQYTSGIKDANVGQGGGKNEDGKAGGVLCLW